MAEVEVGLMVDQAALVVKKVRVISILPYFFEQVHHLRDKRVVLDHNYLLYLTLFFIYLL